MIVVASLMLRTSAVGSDNTHRNNREHSQRGLLVHDTSLHLDKSCCVGFLILSIGKPQAVQAVSRRHVYLAGEAMIDDPRLDDERNDLLLAVAKELWLYARARRLSLWVTMAFIFPS